jgi:hypothetical protein
MFSSHTAWFGVQGMGVPQNASEPCVRHCPVAQVSSLVSPLPVWLQRLMVSPMQRRLPGSQTAVSSIVGVVFEVPPHAAQTNPKLNSTPTDLPILEAIIALWPSVTPFNLLAIARVVSKSNQSNRTARLVTFYQRSGRFLV